MVRAAIDLGTNTFHLLIAEVSERVINEILLQERKYVFLAENGVDHLPKNIFERAREAGRYFRQVLDRYEVDDVRVVGTEALRRSDNGRQLSQELSHILRSPIHVISGEEEALLIASGVKLAMEGHPFNAHAIDIGGGSTEVITFTNGQIDSYTSQVCGIGYLYNHFHSKEPISEKEHEAMRAYISNCYLSYFYSVEGGQKDIAYSIIGVAGSFEVLQSLSGSTPSESSESSDKIVPVAYNVIGSLLKKILPLDLDQRGDFPGMPPERKKYIIEGLTIMDEIFRITGSRELLISRYSIKHGLLFHNF